MSDADEFQKFATSSAADAFVGPRRIGGSTVPAVLWGGCFLGLIALYPMSLAKAATAQTQANESSGALDSSWSINAAMTNEVAHCDLTNQVDPPPVSSGVNWADPREFHITYALGAGHFVLAAINLGGADLRPGASLPVEMHLGGQPAWIAAAHAADEKTLVWTMTIANMATLEQQMHTASGNLVLAFPNSLNADVAFPLEGSSSAIDNLSGCIKAITAGAAAHGGRGMGHSPVYSSPTDARLK